MAPALFPCIFIPPCIVGPLLLEAGGAAPADIQYSQVLNMRGQIAGATPLSQLFIYMDVPPEFEFVTNLAHTGVLQKKFYPVN